MAGRAARRDGLGQGCNPMSRGHGSRQRAVIEALVGSERSRTEGLSLAALPLPLDRSNRRRVIRSLLERGDVEIVDDPETGTRRLRPSFVAALQAMWRLDPPLYGKRGDTERELREEKRALDEAAADLLAREREKRRGRILRDRQLWAEPGSALKRHRALGHRQSRVIAVLIRYAAEDPQMGLPSEALPQIAAQGSGESQRSYERVIDRLLERGTLQQSRDGERVRLTDLRTAYMWKFLPNATSPPLDDSKAKAVLEGFGEDWEPERKGPLRRENQRGTFK